jgi:DNA polymerase-3 subunit gamma/tau
MFGIEYRPLNFKEIVGLDPIKDILKESLKQERYASGYLFHGVLSSGKTTLARTFARAVLCSNRQEDMSPCNECESCKDFLAGKHHGYSEIDSANNGSKDDIKEIKSSLSYESVSGYKIIVFDECHNISIAGNNALLKQLEEPNKNVIIIFCTTDSEKMDSALRSRCWPFRMSLPTESQVTEKLKAICADRDISYEDGALSLIVRKSKRHFRSAENLLDMTSLLGEVNLKNVTSSISFYDDMIVDMLLNSSVSLSKSLKTLDFLMSRMDVKDIYEDVVKVLNDAIKLHNGMGTPVKEYNEMLELLSKKYGDDLFLVLDYVMSKERLKDSTFMQSDMILIHYKFLKKHFKAPIIPDQEDEPEQSFVKAPVSQKSGEKSIDEINKMESWERSEYVRKFKKKQLDKQKKEDLSDIRDSWGSENAQKDVPTDTLKKGIDKSTFVSNIADILDGEEV